MSWVEDRLTEQFYRWELRGRGWQVSDEPVRLEPPFRPFTGHFVPPRPERDDGRRHTLFSGLLDRLSRNHSHNEEAVATGEEDEEPRAEPWEREHVVESQIILPRERRFSRETFASLLLSLSSCVEPLSFEVFGTSEVTTLQFAGHPEDASLLRRQVQGRFQGVVAHETGNRLLDAWSESSPAFAVAEFGLEREFMLTLDASGDWLAGLFAALSELAEGELGIFQVLFEPVQQRWAESALLAVTDGEGGAFFINRPELNKEAVRKFSSPLFAVVLRMAACAETSGRAWRIIAEMASGFSSFAKADGNNFVPLANTHYEPSDHERDLILRQTRRSGMLLNLEELAALLQFPSSSIPTPKLRLDTGRTRAMPLPARDGSIILGENVHAGVVKPVSLTLEQRVRHTHVIGASGSGKSTLLLNLIRQDIENGQGIAVLDPHGDLIERILGIIPEERIGDVVLVDPSDEQYSVGFNILNAHSDFEKTLLASDLVSVFQRLSTSWGDQMASVLNNAILAFLESSEGGTLADLRRFLLDAGFRKQFLRTVQDPDMVYYWEKGFPQLGGNKSIGPVITRLESFLAPKPIRYMVSQRENKLDFADITDSGKIFLAKLSQGQIGRENAYLLGSFIVSKFQQTAMARQRMRAEDRRPFWLYIDEFHHFITPSMAEILSGARKYRMGLTLAHQELTQLKREPEVASAVLSNACTRIVFRVADGEAKSLESGFVHFTARELQNLEVGEAICRVERSDSDFNLNVPFLEDGEEEELSQRRDQVIAASRQRYATPRTQIEAAAQHPPVGAVVEPVVAEKKPLPPVQVPQPVGMPDELKSELAAIKEQLQKVAQVKEEPKPVEKQPEAERPARPEPRPLELGRGGDDHRLIQQRLKASAEGLGFRATIEKSVLNGRGSVDVAMEREGFSLACEITITTTIEHELGNLEKCLEAGFTLVAAVSTDNSRLAELASLVDARVPPNLRERIRFLSPDEVIVLLQSEAIRLAANSEPPKPSETVRRGYKVRRTYVSQNVEEAKASEQNAMKAIADALQKRLK